MAAKLEMRRSLIEMVLELDEPYRTAVMLRFYENLTGVYEDSRAGGQREPMSKVEALQEAKRFNLGHWLPLDFSPPGKIGQRTRRGP